MPSISIEIAIKFKMIIGDAMGDILSLHMAWVCKCHRPESFCLVVQSSAKNTRM